MTKILDKVTSQQAFLLVSALSLLYTVLTLFSPRGANLYHLTSLHIVLLQLTIIVPVLAIWFAATYGVLRFRQYARLIRKSPDGQALSRLTDGLLILVGSFIIQGLLGLLPKYAIGTSVLWPLVFLYNHLPVVLSFVAVYYLYTGSEALAKLAHAKLSARQVITVIVPFLAVSQFAAAIFYMYVTPAVVNGIPNFAAPGKVSFFTLVLPYLAISFLGLLTILNITNYISNIKGVIYKMALRYLAAGIMAVLIFDIFLQFFNLASRLLYRLALGPLLLVIYLVIIFYGLGFILIAIGARKLTQIEAVR